MTTSKRCACGAPLRTAPTSAAHAASANPPAAVCVPAELFDANPIPTWIYDRETLRFLRVNAAALHQYGYCAEEFAGMTLRDIRPADDVLAVLENVAAVTQGFDDAGVWRHRARDGRELLVEITSHTLDLGCRWSPRVWRPRTSMTGCWPTAARALRATCAAAPGPLPPAP